MTINARTITARLIVVTAAIALLAGCIATAPFAPVPAPAQPVQVQVPAQPVQPVQQPEPLNQAMLTTLFDLAGIREELKQLRNSIEEIQFETENAKRRQQDLFENLERRMVSIERNQQVLNPQLAGALSDDSVNQIGRQNNQQGARESVTRESVTRESISEEGISGARINGASANGDRVSQVVVVSGNDTASSTPANSSADQIAIAPQNTLPANGSSTLGAAEPPTIALPQQQADELAYEQAFELLKQSRYEDAIIQFQQMADTWPYSPLADDAYYWMSEARYVNREFEQALNGFKTVVSKYPDSQRVAEALLKVGYIQYDIGAYAKAADTFRDILARFPGHRVTVPAQTRLRRIEQTIEQ